MLLSVMLLMPFGAVVAVLMLFLLVAMFQLFLVLVATDTLQMKTNPVEDIPRECEQTISHSKSNNKFTSFNMSVENSVVRRTSFVVRELFFGYKMN